MIAPRERFVKLVSWRERVVLAFHFSCEERVKHQQAIFSKINPSPVSCFCFANYYQLAYQSINQVNMSELRETLSSSSTSHTLTSCSMERGAELNSDNNNNNLNINDKNGRDSNNNNNNDLSDWPDMCFSASLNDSFEQLDGCRSCLESRGNCFKSDTSVKYKYGLLYTSRENFKLKDFSSEVRATMDVEQFVYQAEMILDMQEVCVEEIIGAMLNKVSLAKQFSARFSSIIS